MSSSEVEGILKRRAELKELTWRTDESRTSLQEELHLEPNFERTRGCSTSKLSVSEREANLLFIPCGGLFKSKCTLLHSEVHFSSAIKRPSYQVLEEILRWKREEPGPGGLMSPQHQSRQFTGSRNRRS